MPSTLQILADLDIDHQDGNIKLYHDADGNLNVDFSGNKVFNKLTKTRLPIRQRMKLLRKLNAVLLRQQQPIIIKVKQKIWMVLGRSKNPEFKSASISYLSQTLPPNTLLYALAGSALAAVLYLVFRKRD